MKKSTDTEAIDAIARLLSVDEWDSDTIENVAGVIGLVRDYHVNDDGYGVWTPLSQQRSAT